MLDRRNGTETTQPTKNGAAPPHKIFPKSCSTRYTINSPTAKRSPTVIQVTLNFPNEQDLLAFFANKKAMISHQPGLPSETGEFISAETLNKPMPDPKREAKAKPEPKPEAEPTPAAEPAEAPASAASTAAPTDSQTGTVEYPVLQKAVFTLAGKSREAAAEVAQSFGVKTFKELDASKWGEALAAVNAKIAELG